VSLGVGRVVPVALIGDDGEGYELRQALARMPVVDATNVLSDASRRTPTYTKPMLCEAGTARELNRLDVKNRKPLPTELEERVLAALEETWPKLDALLVLDQVSEAECGVVTTGIRTHLAALALTDPDKLILADSRERIHLFRDATVKVNGGECEKALRALGLVTEMRSPGLSPVRVMGAEAMVKELAARSTRPVFCTWGDLGIHLAGSANNKPTLVRVPAYPVAGPIDIVGAGDSTSAGIACALAAETSLEQAAAFGNLVASITIQQIGVTGTASPDQVRERWREVRDRQR
jgi:bifunctional ADP-heptose synthase (sugar kinase/adenylyltransferase)